MKALSIIDYVNVVINDIKTNYNFSEEDLYNKKAIQFLNRYGFSKLKSIEVNWVEIEKYKPCEFFKTSIRVNLYFSDKWDHQHYIPSQELLSYLGQNLLVDKEFFSTLAQLYQNNLGVSHRKKTGVFYTQNDVVDYMIDNSFKYLDNDKTIKVLDPSCGTGNFLSAVVRYARKNKIWPLKMTVCGIDIDIYAIEIALSRIIIENDFNMDLEIHMINQDALLHDNILGEFDLIIGNPPYIGHKQLSLDYKKLLKDKFPATYKDKSDISYCFFDKFLDLLKPSGILSFITSRYFIEALHGQGVRRKIGSCTVLDIIDFYGYRILEGIQVDPLIITLGRGREEAHSSIRRVIKPENHPLSELLDVHSTNISYFSVPQGEYSKEQWSLYPTDHNQIINKLFVPQHIKLNHAVDSFQGIITGCDKAFVIDNQLIEYLGIDKRFTKPWLKSRHVHQFIIDNPGQSLIYSDDIDDIDNYPQIKKQIEQYRTLLEGRRECIKGIRKWYQLQWGRDKSFFGQPKIIYRYKAAGNTFALDNDGFFHSADIYGFVLKGLYNHILDYYYLCCFLNSSIIEFYLKSTCKKLGDKLYEYYPNKVLEVPVPLNYDKDYFDNAYNKIVSGHKTGKAEIDEYFYSLFNISKEQEEYIRSWLLK